MKTPNSQQEKLIDSREGIFLVDAGAGTGKTFTLTRRYARILQEEEVTPGEILLTTFTENAAENMRERIRSFLEEERPGVADAPITTFHSYCKDLLERKGINSPSYLGIDSMLTGFDVLDGASGYFENKRFERFFRNFERNHPEYRNFFRIYRSGEKMLGLIKKLCCKGVFPTAEGWYRDGRKVLEGDYDEMKARFEEVNQPQQGKRGPKNSVFKNRMRSFDSYLFSEDAPSKQDIRPKGMKKVPEEFFEKAFEEDREELFSFIHDIYFEYIEFSVENGFLNFQFLMMLAYVVLVEDEEVRESERFEYMMVDEFQDTNELQFKLALVLSETGNIAAVGDWKQSIFSFQNASVDNILEFGKRVERYAGELNREEEIIDFPLDITRISLKKNYRSGQEILETAEKALLMKGSRNEKLDREEIKNSIVSLESESNYDTRIESFVAEEEKNALLAKIQEAVEDESFRLDGRILDYGDIAVITRTRRFGIELEKKAREYNIPAAFEGGVDLFSTDPGKLVLAWLRILSGKEEERGWAVVLDRAGYSPGQVKYVIDCEEFPTDMESFKNRIDDKEPSEVAQKVFDRYGIDNGFTSKIISVLSELGGTTVSVVSFIESCIENGTEFEVDDSRGSNLVTIRTIHGSKGLEYPAVFIPDINNSHFPSRGSSFRPLDFSYETGLRQRKLYDSERNCITSNWRSKILFRSFPTEYDEERRLFYVAMTRAKKYLFISAEKGKESRFFRGLEIPAEDVETEPEVLKSEKDDRKPPKIPEKTLSRPRKLSAHFFVDSEKVKGEGRGTEFGNKVHRFAEKIINGEEAEGGEEEDFRNTKMFIEDQEGGKNAESSVMLPLEKKGRKFAVEGIIDMLVEKEEIVKIVDFKTDTDNSMEEEYRKQLSIYYHAIREIFPEKEVQIMIFYTYTGEEKELEPVEKEVLISLLNT